MSLVQTVTNDGVALVTLDDPRRRNALSLVMAEEMKTVFGTLGSSPDVSAVVLTGAPPATSRKARPAKPQQAHSACHLYIY